MSNETTNTETVDYVSILGNQYPEGAAVRKARKGKDGKMTKAYPYPVVTGSSEEVASFAHDLIVFAEQNKEGQGLSFFASVFNPLFLEAYPAASDAATGEYDWNKLLTEIVKGAEKRINLTELSREINSEFGVIIPLVVEASDTPEVVASKTAAREAAGLTEDEVVQRYTAVIQKNMQYLRMVAEWESGADEREAKRRANKEKKEQEAAAAKANAAAAAAATGAAQPV